MVSADIHQHRRSSFISKRRETPQGSPPLVASCQHLQQDARRHAKTKNMAPDVLHRPRSRPLSRSRRRPAGRTSRGARLSSSSPECSPGGGPSLSRPTPFCGQRQLNSSAYAWRRVLDSPWKVPWTHALKLDITRCAAGRGPSGSDASKGLCTRFGQARSPLAMPFQPSAAMRDGTSTRASANAA